MIGDTYDANLATDIAGTIEEEFLKVARNNPAVCRAMSYRDLGDAERLKLAVIFLAGVNNQQTEVIRSASPYQLVNDAGMTAIATATGDITLAVTTKDPPI
jgi:hypothetical protein